MENLLPQFGGTAFTVLAFIVALSIIVAVHEYGHYIVGRWSGIDADVFSIGFGPVIFSRTDRRGTRWQVAAFPLGGYVRFRGDADAASMGRSAEVAPARNTMMGAPLWARSATVFAGPLFNFLMSFVIFAALIGLRGQVAEPMTIAEVPELPAAYVVELEPGDEVLAIDGARFDNLEELGAVIDDLPWQRSLTYTVLRDGREREVSGPYPYLPLAAGIVPRSASDDAGMRVGDLILSAGGQEIAAFDQLVEIVTGSGGQPIGMQVWRDGEVIEVTLTPRRSDEPQAEGGYETFYRIGIQGGFLYDLQTEPVGLGTMLLNGAAQVWTIISSSLSGLYHMLTGAISTCNLSGPVGIAEASASMASQGTTSFIWFIAVLSTAVGLLNLFPIPVLDGGHLVFHAYEAVTGTPPGDNALRLLMAVGLSLVLTLMLFGLANDLLLCP